MGIGMGIGIKGGAPERVGDGCAAYCQFSVRPSEGWRTCRGGRGGGGYADG